MKSHSAVRREPNCRRARVTGSGIARLVVGSEEPSICAKKAHDDGQRPLTAWKASHLSDIEERRRGTRVTRKNAI